MKLIIFTTCKPFEGDDAWRQEQAIKSWTLLQGMEKKIIVVGNEKVTKEICDKYDLIHEPEVKNLSGIPYLHSMLEIGAKHSEPDDYLLWTNSDMIYYDDMIINILSFDYIKKMNNIKNFSLIGGRIDWHNPRILEDLSKKHFLSNLHLNERKTSRSITEICQTESTFYECSQHALCGIDYVIHSPTTYIDKIDKNLVIAGTRHDMILVGTALSNGYFTCNITNTNLVVHQNHGYALGGHNSNELTKNVLIPNNQRCNGIMARIDQSPVFTMADPNTKKIQFLTSKHINN